MFSRIVVRKIRLSWSTKEIWSRSRLPNRERQLGQLADRGLQPPEVSEGDQQLTWGQLSVDHEIHAQRGDGRDAQGAQDPQRRVQAGLHGDGLEAGLEALRALC